MVREDSVKVCEGGEGGRVRCEGGRWCGSAMSARQMTSPHLRTPREKYPQHLLFFTLPPSIPHSLFFFPLSSFHCFLIAYRLLSLFASFFLSSFLFLYSPAPHLPSLSFSHPLHFLISFPYSLLFFSFCPLSFIPRPSFPPSPAQHLFGRVPGLGGG